MKGLCNQRYLIKTEVYKKNNKNEERERIYGTKINI